MKKIYTDQNLTHCDMVRGCLESSSIPSVLRNEYQSRTTGGGFGSPLGFVWPEVWVVNDEDLENAVVCMREADFSFLKQ